MNSYHSDLEYTQDYERERQRRRAQRQARRRRRRIQRRIRALCALAVVGLTATAAVSLIDRQPEQTDPVPDSGFQQVQAAVPEVVLPELEPEVVEPVWAIRTTTATARIRSDFPSQYAILLDLDTGEVLAERSSAAAISPASMTKILTLLVAAEHVTPEQLESGTFTMTRAVEDYVFTNRCSVVGYEVGEEIPVRELFYGCILCSGADACMGLAETIFGSHEAMVEAMNAKAEELGLSEEAHFTNCIGLYDEDLRCTVRDIALILRSALENEFCREVLTTSVYESVPTPYHEEGQVLLNQFTRRIQYQETGCVTVTSAKTGYVSESGFCAASYGEGSDGRRYICVTGKSTGTQQSVKDHAELYRTFCPVPEKSEGTGSNIE